MGTSSADRLSGAFFLLLGLTLYFAIIPAFVETAEDGNIAPATLPNLVSLIIALCGLLLVIKPTDHEIQNKRQLLVTAAYVVVLVIALYSISQFGFIYVAPVLALVLMLMIGERRWYWLGLGCLGMPAVIWLLVVQILDRSLP